MDKFVPRRWRAIGRAVAARMVSDGWQVLAVDLRPDPDGPGSPFEADLTDPEANAAAAFAALREKTNDRDQFIPVQHFATMGAVRAPIARVDDFGIEYKMVAVVAKRDDVEKAANAKA